AQKKADREKRPAQAWSRRRSDGRAHLLDFGTSRSARPRVFDLREPEELQHPDVDPSDVKLEPPGGKACRLGVGVVVVVKLLAAKPDRDRGDVPALVLDLEIPVAKGVADTIDDSGGPERDPEHLDSPHKRTNEKAEEVDVDAEHQHDAEPVQTAEQVTLEPIVRCAFAVLLEHSRLSDRLAVIE